MKIFPRIALFTVLVFSISANVYPKNYQTAGTGYIGGVTLFDEANPLLSLNNPGLLNNYGKNQLDPGQIWIDFDYQKSSISDDEDFSGDFDYIDATIDPRVYAPAYSFGRIFVLNAFFSTTVSGDAIYQSSYFMNLLEGNLKGSQNYLDIPGLGQIYYQPLISALTFGVIDITPLFSSNTANTASQISNTLEILKNGKIGASAEININVLSYYRHHFGLTFYISADTKAGFFGDEKNLLLVEDPTVDIELQAGLAFGMGVGIQDLPLVGKVMLGYTVRAFVEITGHSESIDDALLMYEQINAYASNANAGQIFDFSAFGNGELARGGFGLALDFGFYKPVSQNFIIAGKLADIISPRYWIKSGLADPYFGWKLPDLSLGFRYTLPLTKSIWFIINEPSFYFQFDDLLYTYPVSFLAKIHAGFDIKFLFDIFHIGAGINAGYPTLGFTVHITPAIMGNVPVLNLIPIWYFHLKVHFSLYGKELGRYPGEFGFQGYNIAVETYFGI